MDGEAGTTVADRSTAAVGVANGAGEAPLAAQQDGATSDGTTTDDQTSSTTDGAAPQNAPEEQQTATTDPAQKDQAAQAAQTVQLDQAAPAEPTAPQESADPTTDSGPADSDMAATVGATADGATSATKTITLKAGAEKTAKPDPEEPGTAETVAAKSGPAKSDSAKSVTAAKPDTAKDEPQSAVTATRKLTRPAGAHGTPPELHSGHKLARRYQLAECVTRVDGFSSWRAVDEKLRRAVGIHLLPADHPRARPVLAAARSAALLGDPRFVQVLDAVEENDLVYVIHEWLPDATSLADLLTAGPLEPHEAYQMVSQVSQGMAAAHREGLAHLRLDPGAVLRTVSGQYRIRGLSVAAALRGLDSERPQRQDTEAIGALLYATLTQRWPYEEDAHGLTGLPKGVGLVAPDQVRAGVHRGLSEITMRALVNEGATASREESPCTTPEELAKAVAGIPRIRPPEHPPAYQLTAFRQPPPPPRTGSRQAVVPPAPPPTLPGRTGQALKWAVAALLIVAIGLGSWQLADALKSREDQSTGTTPTGQKAGQNTKPPAPVPVTIVSAKEYSADGTPQDVKDVANTFDGSLSTSWRTRTFLDGPKLAPYKPGVGIIYDLGAARRIRSASLTFRFGGDHTTVDLYGTDSLSPSGGVSQMTKIATTQTSEKSAVVSVKNAPNTRYVLVWLTALPYSTTDQYFAAGYKQAIEEVKFTR